VKALQAGDPLLAAMTGLYANPRRSMPANPYTDDGVLARIWNYRHQVTHRRRQPFQFNVLLGDVGLDFGDRLRGRWRRYRHARKAPHPPLGRSGTAHLILDPRVPPGTRSASTFSIPSELNRMLDLVRERCEAALLLL